MSHPLIRAVAFAGLATGLIFAQGSGLSKGKPARREALKQLNLTPDQKSQAKQIFAQAKLDNAPLRAELKQNRHAMAEAIRTAKSEDEIRQLAQQQGDVLGQMIAVRSQARARFAAQLTPEQRSKAQELLHNRKE